MPNMNIRHYFPFRRVKILNQVIETKENRVMINMVPNNRFTPVCHVCGKPSRHVHAHETRQVRDLPMAAFSVWLVCQYRKLLCNTCSKITTEDLGVFNPYQRVTVRMAIYIHELCKMLTVKEVAEHLNLDWKTVKNIDKAFLMEQYAQTDYRNLRILAVDEIAIRKGHKYMTVVLDYETGRVVWMGKDRSSDTLKEFFKGMSEEQKQNLDAIAMDMWNPFIRAVRESVPHVKIVFDFFHVVSAFNKVIDKVRISEFNNAAKEDQEVFKGSKYLLLKNRPNLKTDEKAHLKKLQDINKNIFTMMLLKENLKRIWKYQKRGWADNAIDIWCTLAHQIEHPEVERFIGRLERYRYGILNHCEYPIHTSRLEGVNNKIKVIKRKAYGYHDKLYFTLKVKQAFDTTNDSN